MKELILILALLNSIPSFAKIDSPEKSQKIIKEELKQSSLQKTELASFISATNNTELVPHSKVTELLKKISPQMKIYSIKDFHKSIQLLFANSKNDSPMGFLADFNGDHLQDLALMTYDQNSSYILIFLNSLTELQVVTVEKTPYINPKKVKTVFYQSEDTGLISYISLLAQKDIQWKKNSKQQRDLIQLETYLGSTLAYYYDGTKMVAYKGQPL